MRATDRAILLGLLIVGLVAAFWFVILSPKRDEVSKLDDEVTATRTAVEEQEQLAAFAEDAKADYESNYHRLVVLGKAIPGDDDQASLIEQTDVLAQRSGVEFRGLALASSSARANPAPAGQTTAAPPPES
ncbi:MAG: hypothetical protein ACRDKX_02035, partial [Solirubrobacterales bacterium]